MLELYRIRILNGFKCKFMTKRLFSSRVGENKKKIMYITKGHRSLPLSQEKAVEKFYTEKIDQVVKNILKDIKLRKELILQCLTDKSFQRGNVPYNDRLSALGQSVLRGAIIEDGIAAKGPIYAYNMGNAYLESFPISYFKGCSIFPVVRKLAVSLGLQDVVRCDSSIIVKLENEHDNVNNSNSDTAAARSLLALIGAISIEHGSVIAQKFVIDELANKKGGLKDIYKESFVKKNVAKFGEKTGFYESLEGKKESTEKSETGEKKDEIEKEK